MRFGVVGNAAAVGNRPRELSTTGPGRVASGYCPVSKQGDNLSDLQITQPGGSTQGGQLQITQTNGGNPH